MSTSMDSYTIHQRIGFIVAKMPAIGKTQRNEQQKFMYRGHDDVMNALNPLLSEYGVFFVPRVLERITDQRQTRSGGVMYEVNLLVEYTFYGPLGDSFTASAWGEGTDSGDKSTNKAMTMALKNVLAQTFAVTTEEHSLLDTDRNSDEQTSGRASATPAPAPAPAAAAAAAPVPVGSAKKPSAVQKRMRENLMKELGEYDPLKEWDDTIEAWVTKSFDGRGIPELTGAEFEILLRKLATTRQSFVDAGVEHGTVGASPEQTETAINDAGLGPMPTTPTDLPEFGENSPPGDEG